MNRKLPLALFVMIFGIVLAGNPLAATAATTYYIAANGSDSNSGTSESTPWAHLPGMATWTGNHTPAAGDTFILRGNDVWTNSSFPITWSWSGISSSGITVGVDKTWFSGTSWNRPVFTAGGAPIDAPDCPSGSSGPHYFLVLSRAQYVTFQSIEWTGLFWNNDQQNACYQSAGFFYANQSDYITIDQMYIHKWTHGTTAGTTDSSDLIAYTTYGTPPYCFNCVVSNSVINNSDGDGASSSTISGGGVRNWNLENNVIAYVVQGFLSPIYSRPSQLQVTGNNISHIGESFTTPGQSAPPHPNCIETTGVVGGSSGTAVLIVANNYIHDIQTCEGLQVGNPNEDDIVFNNIWDMGASATGGANGPQVPQGSSSHNFEFWNNTVRWASGCMTAGIHGTTFNSFIVENNHCINDATTVVNGSIPGSTLSNNVGMTNANATSQGYTSSETYVFAPTAANNGTVGAGADLAANWPAGFSTNDTTYACAQQTVSGVIESVCPTRSTTNARTSSWDVGAYQWSSSTGSPNPPTGLSAVVQ